MKKLLMTFLLILMQINIASGKLANQFYEAPSYSRFIKHLDEFDNASNKHVENLISVFTICVLQRHPDYIEELIKAYPNFSSLKQQMMAQALYIVQGEQITKKLPIAPSKLPDHLLDFTYLDNITLKFPVKTENDLTYNSDNADYLWSAFDATGDRKYLVKILQFLSSEELFIKTLATEMINRDMLTSVTNKLSGKQEKPDYNDLFDALNKNYPKDPAHYQRRLMSYYITLWSFNSNKTRFSDIDKKIKEIIRERPDLDFAKDIKL
jgi:hypothetical protein